MLVLGAPDPDGLNDGILLGRMDGEILGLVVGASLTDGLVLPEGAVVGSKLALG